MSDAKFASIQKHKTQAQAGATAMGKNPFGGAHNPFGLSRERLQADQRNARATQQKKNLDRQRQIGAKQVAERRRIDNKIRYSGAASVTPKEMAAARKMGAL